jgi:hypothetical protein
VCDNGALRRLREVHSAPLFNPGVDNLLIELFFTQRVSFAPVLISGTGIDALESLEISMAQCCISRDVRKRKKAYVFREVWPDAPVVTKVNRFKKLQFHFKKL